MTATAERIRYEQLTPGGRVERSADFRATRRDQSGAAELHADATGGRVTFLIAAGALPMTPRAGDRITDAANVRWAVARVGRAGTDYELECNRLMRSELERLTDEYLGGSPPRPDLEQLAEQFFGDGPTPARKQPTRTAAVRDWSE